MMLDLFPDQILQPSNHFDQEARLLADRHYRMGEKPCSLCTQATTLSRRMRKEQGAA